MDGAITVQGVLALQHLKLLTKNQLKALLFIEEPQFSLAQLVTEIGRGSVTKRALQLAQDFAFRQLEALNRHRITPLLLTDPRYPHLLRSIADPPIILYSKGDISKLSARKPVTIIGSRTASAYSSEVARRLGYLFSASPFAVVSGLAVGIDAAAHRGALDVADGCTIAVLANSLDSIYPKENTGLAQEILDRGGCLVSEQPPGAVLRKSHFIQRNRIQSALSYAAILVQSAINGGSMHTMKFAAEQGRILAAYEHHSADAQYAGNQKVIQMMRGFALNNPESIVELQKMVSIQTFSAHVPSQSSQLALNL